MNPLNLQGEWRWLGSGFLLMAFSGFGQTYYIAIFAGQLKSTIQLTDGGFGSLYSVATLGSAAVLAWAGKYADDISVRWLGAAVLGGLAVTSIAMAHVNSTLTLGLVFFGLRFFGQGMCTHVALTAMGRWFNQKRGKAVSIAGLGLPFSEGLLPLFAVGMISLTGWRNTWLVSALLVVIGIPVLITLLKHERHPTRGPLAKEHDSRTPGRHHWTRTEVVRNPTFYLLMPITLAAPFILTGIFISQVPVAEIKGWDLSLFAASFPLLAITHVVAALATGKLVDRFSARHVLAVSLMPLALGSAILVYATNPLALPVLMMVLGVSMGMSSTTHAALWAELYGIDNLGSIRSIITAATVFATAVAPGLIGMLMDHGVALEFQLQVMTLYCLIAALLAHGLRPALDRVAAS
ncbi:MAG: MFS transporter [Woeseia sp.]